jgi:hypothetical protein
LPCIRSHALPRPRSSCDLGPRATLLESSFRRGCMIQQGLQATATIQEAGPPRQPFRRALGPCLGGHATLALRQSVGAGEGSMASSSLVVPQLSPLDRPYHLSASIATLIFAQISTKISRLAGSWLAMLQVLSLTLACSAYRALVSLLNRHCATGRVRANA